MNYSNHMGNHCSGVSRCGILTGLFGITEMNERIRELAEQASVLSYRQYIDSGDHRFVQNGDAVQKFAELIVRECANRATWAQDTSAADIGGEVLKHFGVEE
jgi:hypothetical protein